MSKTSMLVASSLAICSASAAWAASSEIDSASVDARLKWKTENTNQMAKISKHQELNPLFAMVDPKLMQTPLVHQVQKGDTLYQIGLRYGVSYLELAVYNKLTDPEQLHVGQELKIPVVKKWFLAKKGQSPLAIAKQHNMSTEVFLELNPQLNPDQPFTEDQWILVTHKLKSSVKATFTAKKKEIFIPKSADKSEGTEESSSFSFIWPINGTITSGFGWRHGEFHKGIDIWSAALSREKIHAALGGIVVRAGLSNGYGNLVVVDHGNGWVTYYAHLSSIHVSKGQRVVQGQVIGNMGRTGNATGYHLHFEIRKHGKPVNPLTMLP
jgi:murein DD-endopeptidase MepM/ murein hydrolase activator NlpD